MVLLRVILYYEYGSKIYLQLHTFHHPDKSLHCKFLG